MFRILRMVKWINRKKMKWKYFEVESSIAQKRSFLLILQEIWPLRNIPDNIQTQKCFVSWFTMRAFSAQYPVPNAPKEPPCYPKSIMFQFHICYQSHWNVSWKTKTNINFRGQTWVRLPAKCWFKGCILPLKYHVPNFYRRFCHTLVTWKCKN